jgi:hypothetical protein
MTEPAAADGEQHIIPTSVQPNAVQVHAGRWPELRMLFGGSRIFIQHLAYQELSAFFARWDG